MPEFDLFLGSGSVSGALLSLKVVSCVSWFAGVHNAVTATEPDGLGTGRLRVANHCGAQKIAAVLISLSVYIDMVLG